MTKLELSKNGYDYICLNETVSEAVKYIDEMHFDGDVLLDLKGCIFSYNLSKIFDAVINKLKNVPGGKKVTIDHNYHSAWERHLLSYFVNDSIIIKSDDISNLDDLKNELTSKYEIELCFLEK